MISIRQIVCAAAMLLLATTGHAEEKVSGSVKFKNWSSALKYAWMVRSPDEMDASKSILRIYLSSADIGAKIKACKTLSCANLALEDGAMVDFSDARHLAYAVKLNGQRVQYSGGTDGDAFKLSTNRPDHLAGKLHIDDASVGGAKVDAEFDLMLTNTFKTVR